jgi:hypothetical protein
MKLILLFGLGLGLVGCGATGTPPSNTVTSPEVTAVQPTETISQQEATAETQPTSTTAPQETPAMSDDDLDHAELLNQVLFSSSTSEAEATLTDIRAAGDTRFVAGLIDILRYQFGLRDELGLALNELTGENLTPDWFEWVEWAGQHPEIESFADYPGWKANLFAQIDPNFSRFIYQGMKVDPNSRVEEIVWGGVRVDGIPALDNPKMVDPAGADYLIPEERVFGVSLNGDTRAYPARFLDWHEMFNDVIGGEPVSLAY